jgi:hypothetical protein
MNFYLYSMRGYQLLLIALAIVALFVWRYGWLTAAAVAGAGGLAVWKGPGLLGKRIVERSDNVSGGLERKDILNRIWRQGLSTHEDINGTITIYMPQYPPRKNVAVRYTGDPATDKDMQILDNGICTFIWPTGEKQPDENWARDPASTLRVIFRKVVRRDYLDRLAETYGITHTDLGPTGRVTLNPKDQARLIRLNFRRGGSFVVVATPNNGRIELNPTQLYPITIASLAPPDEKVIAESWAEIPGQIFKLLSNDYTVTDNA